jgi:hypothetical protein
MYDRGKALSPHWDAVCGRVGEPVHAACPVAVSLDLGGDVSSGSRLGFAPQPSTAGAGPAAGAGPTANPSELEDAPLQTGRFPRARRCIRVRGSPAERGRRWAGGLLCVRYFRVSEDGNLVH